LRRFFLIASLIVLLASLLALLNVTARATPPKQPTIPVTVMPQLLRGFVAPAKRPTDELSRLLKSIKAIEHKSSQMTQTKRRKIAQAAMAASKTAGVDATLLIAIAKMESDFRPARVIGWRCRRKGYQSCMADCGITQHNISGSPKYVLRRCKKLARDYQLSFTKSAKEIAHHIKWCQRHHKWNRPLRRCVLNRYNSGTFYRTDARCNRRWRYCKTSCPDSPWNDKRLSDQEKQYQHKRRQQCKNRCFRVKRKCQSRARYWVKVLCYDYGARNGLRSRRPCRLAWSVRDIATKHYRAPRPKRSVQATASR